MRAFLNGRIDPTQAEAVRDLIESQTLYQAQVAARQLEGALSKRLQPTKQKLMELIAIMEAGVEFLEDDVAAIPDAQILSRIAAIRAPDQKACWLVAGVRKLPAAHLLTVDLDRWTFDDRCYWHMENAPALRGNPAQIIREQLEESIELVTRADVPIGIALSGGLDASAVAALACTTRRKDIQAFTVGYAGTPWQDERAHAKAFADYLRIPIHSVELSTADFIKQYSDVNLHRDDPIADIAGVAIAAVARLSHRHSVPVLLFGHGGDELFWGYQWMRSALHATRRRTALSAGMRGIADYLRFSPPPLSVTLSIQWAMSGAGILNELRQFQADRRASHGRVVFYDNEPFFRSSLGVLDEDFYGREFAAKIGYPDMTQGFVAKRSDSTPEVTLIRLICETYLTENGIAQGDRLSMAASVESRLPLIDYRLVETVVGLHKTYPLGAEDRPKQWFRDALSGILPDFVLSRRKVGFSPPWREWGRALAVTYGEQLLDGYLVQTGVLRPEIAAKHQRDLFPRFTGPRPRAGLSLGLENWCRQMAAGPNP